MDRLSEELCLKIFCSLDEQNLATAQQANLTLRSNAGIVLLHQGIVNSFKIILMCGRSDFLEVRIKGYHCLCRKWKVLASDNILWSKLFKERWGGDHAAFYAPVDSKSWKDVYEVQDRCDRVGLGLKIIREGDEYYLVHQGEIQRYLGSRSRRGFDEVELGIEGSIEEGSREGILNKILFFIGDLEVASTDAKLG